MKKLEIPTFNSDPKMYHKWKQTFLRYTSNYDEEAKYDYLLSHTEGEANRYIANRREFSEAIEKLDEKFGNIHDIMGILTDEIKAISLVHKGDFKGFESLTLKVNDFQDRLILMGKEHEVENSFILKEIEGKLQKWLESQGEDVDR